MNQWPANVQQDLLDHEQGHYDITALVARDLFILLMQQKTRVFSSEADCKTDYNNWIRIRAPRLGQIDSAYDTETGHSQAGVFVPSTNLFTPPHQKGAPQVKWERLIASAFNEVRPAGGVAPDGTLYKSELLDVLIRAGVSP